MKTQPVKRWRTVFPLVLWSLLALVLLPGCQDQPLPTGLAPTTTSLGAFADYDPPEVLEACDEVTNSRLLAGQTMRAGWVQVWNTEDAIHVRYHATGMWALQRTHLEVATDLGRIPTNRSGNPVPGQFSLSSHHEPWAEHHTETVYLADLGVEPGDVVFVAAHAEVAKGGELFESAWGEGTRFVQRGNWATYFTHEVTECGSPPPPPSPPPGRDVVVFNDLNIFDERAMENPNNVQLVKNLVNYTAMGSRAGGNGVWWDLSRNTACSDFECGPFIQPTRDVILAEGFFLEEFKNSPAPLAAIPANIKVLFLWLPRIAFTLEEINSMKAFAEEGGRIVFVGEWNTYYTQQGLDVENQFLINMGAVLRNTGGAVDCGYNTLTAESIRPHQVTQGVTELTIACASIIEPGPGDYPLFYDTSGQHLLGGVAVIDTTPLDELIPLASPMMATVTQEGVGGKLNPASSTGH
jgi:hypothetical protein